MAKIIYHLLTHKTIFLCYFHLIEPTLACNGSCQCQQSGTSFSATCNGGTFEELVSSIPSQTKTITFNMKGMKGFGELNLSHVKKLKNLYITAGKLKTIDGASLKKVSSKLEKFRLKNTEIKELPSELFHPVPDISSLQIKKNKKLTKIDFKIFEPLPQLVTLDLSNNNLSDIGSNFFYKFPHIKELDLTANNIKKIPKMIINRPPDLTRLTLKHNSIEEIPNLPLPNLQQLFLSYNRITTIQINAFSNTTNLEGLYLNHNFLRNHPGLFTYLPKTLKHVALDYNYLTMLPKLPSTIQSFEMMGNEVDCSCYLIEQIKSLPNKTINIDCNYTGQQGGRFLKSADSSCARLHSDWQLSIVTLKSKGDTQFHGYGSEQYILVFNLFIPPQNKQDNSSFEESNLHKQKQNVLSLMTREMYSRQAEVFRIISHTENKSMVFMFEFNKDESYKWEPVSGRNYLIEIMKINDGYALRTILFINGKKYHIYKHEGSWHLQNLIIYGHDTSLYDQNISLYGHKIDNVYFFTKNCHFQNGGCSDKCTYDQYTKAPRCDCSNGFTRISKSKCALKSFFYYSKKDTSFTLFDGKSGVEPWITSHEFASCSHNYEEAILYCVQINRNRNISELYALNLVKRTIRQLTTMPYRVQRVYYENKERKLYHILLNRLISSIKIYKNNTATSSIRVVVKSREGITAALEIDTCQLTNKGLITIFVFRIDLKAITAYTINTKENIKEIESERIVADNLFYVSAITLDQIGNRLYWGDSFANIIESSNTDGKCRFTYALLPPDTKISAMTFQQTSVYWLDSHLQNETSIWKTTQYRSSKLQTRNEQIVDIGTYQNPNIRSCFSSCHNFIVIVDESSKNFYEFKKYPKNIVQRGLHIEHKLILSKKINFLGSFVNTLYISPKGDISLSPSPQQLDIADRLDFPRLALYLANTTNRFTGDVFVSETIDKDVCKSAEDDIKESFNKHDETETNRPADWFKLKPGQNLSQISVNRLIIITWSLVGLVNDNTRQNSFQAVIVVTTNDDTFVIVNYGRLGTKYGIVGWTTVDCPSKDRLSSRTGGFLEYTRTVLKVSDLCGHTELARTRDDGLSVGLYILFAIVFICVEDLIIVLIIKCHKKYKRIQKQKSDRARVFKDSSFFADGSMRETVVYETLESIKNKTDGVDVSRAENGIKERKENTSDENVVESTVAKSVESNDGVKTCDAFDISKNDTMC